MAAASHASSRTARGNHYSCSLSAVLIARVQAYGGEEAVAEMLRLAGSDRTPEYLLEASNWISYDEMLALWRAGAQMTHHPQLSRLPFLQHLPRLLCYDVAHVHTGPVQEKEATGWTLWRWWIR